MISIKPEVEQLIDKNVRRGHYTTADEFIERAVRMLDEQEEWLWTNRAEISSRIEDGFSASLRGELIGSEEVKALMGERKRAWHGTRGQE